MKTADFEVLRDAATATNFGTKIAITGFVWTIVTRLLVMEGVWVVGQQNADIADTLQLRRRCRGNHFLAFYIWVHTGHLRVRRRCGLMSNYFDHLLWPPLLTFTFAICCRPSVCRLSVCRLSVGNARAPYSGGCNFRQYFYGIWYASHPLTSVKNFMEIFQW